MSDDLFNLNLTDVEELDTGSIGPMPAGDYEMVAMAWESKNSKATGHKMISVTYEVVGPKYQGRKVWENYMLEGNGLNVSKGKLRNWRKAMGMNPDLEAFGLEDLESMMNVPFNAGALQISRAEIRVTVRSGKTRMLSLSLFLAVASLRCLPLPRPQILKPHHPMMMTISIGISNAKYLSFL